MSEKTPERPQASVIVSGGIIHNYLGIILAKDNRSPRIPDASAKKNPDGSIVITSQRATNQDLRSALEGLRLPIQFLEENSSG